MLLAVEIIGILFMLTFIFIGIWGFIILNQIYAQFKYKNYLLEKLNLNVKQSIQKENDEFTETPTNSSKTIVEENESHSTIIDETTIDCFNVKNEEI